MFDPTIRYTLDEYWRLAEALPEHKFEYVEGNIRLMTGSSPAHEHIATNIIGLLSTALRSQECNVYSEDVAVQLHESHLYYPDISVSCDPVDWTHAKALEAPSVIVEVLSPATKKIDKTEKLEIYQRYPTIQEILQVDSQRARIEHYHRFGTYMWEEALYEHTNDRVTLKSLGISFTLQDAYMKVYLEMEETS